MDVIYLILIIIGISAQHIAKKAYSVKSGGGAALTFSAVSVFCALIFFICISGFKLDFTPEILPYAFGFGLTYATAVLGAFCAIRYGSLSLTSLITSYSLIIPSIYGILFLGEQTGIILYLGLAASMVSLFLANYKKGEEPLSKDESKNYLKWILFVILAFLGNGICSTVQMVQQKNFDGKYKSEIMIIALATVLVIFSVLAFVKERKEVLPTVKSGGLFMCANGGFNGLVNLLVMLCATKMNASIMYPVISAGGIICTALVSILFYKEKLTKMQYIAFILGIAAIVLLNL